MHHVVVDTRRGGQIRVVALAVCFDSRGRVLLEHGCDTGHDKHFLRPIGGGIDFGEPAVDALAREWAEEYRLTIAAPRLLGVLENIFEDEGRPGYEIAFVFTARRGRQLTPPVEPAVAAALYTRYRGDLRNFLRLLSRAVQHHAITAPGTPLGASELVTLMAPRYWSELVKRIGETDARHLAGIYAGKAHDTEFRVADAVQAIGTITQPAASKLVQRLATAGVIAQSRVEGKSVYYRLRTGDLTIALGLG